MQLLPLAHLLLCGSYDRAAAPIATAALAAAIEAGSSFYRLKRGGESLGGLCSTLSSGGSQRWAELSVGAPCGPHLALAPKESVRPAMPRSPALSHASAARRRHPPQWDA